MSARDSERMQRAQAYLVRRCMRSFGFADFPLAPRPRGQLSESFNSTMTLVEVSPYGMLDLGQARHWGYGFDPDRVEEGVAGGLPKGRPPTQREFEVLHGSTTDDGGDMVVRGREVPEGGCSAEGSRRLMARVADEERMWGYVSGRVRRIDKAVAKDPRVLRAFRDWSRCVQGKGFKEYENPADAFRDEAWRAGRGDGNTARTKRELGTAVADVTCNRQLNTAGVWWAVSNERQRAELRRNKSRYTAVRADLDRLRAAVGKALGESAGKAAGKALGEPAGTALGER
ncbi:hypothetical protein [Streptomyces sp. NRRL S-920]|uniref:hypothetical protein n=1 Tax=Streptomyces sp. NRRL S-920 TaxID=1463921 RepID=UPI0018FEA08D|nr:hypothetical protein [Streptomyces sp. NRRL S-920]